MPIVRAAHFETPTILGRRERHLSGQVDVPEIHVHRTARDRLARLDVPEHPALLVLRDHAVAHTRDAVHVTGVRDLREVRTGLRESAGGVVGIDRHRRGGTCGRGVAGGAAHRAPLMASGLGS